MRARAFRNCLRRSAGFAAPKSSTSPKMTMVPADKLLLPEMSGNVRPAERLHHRLDLNFTIPPYIQRAAREGRVRGKRRDGQGAVARGAGRATVPAGAVRCAGDPHTAVAARPDCDLRLR